MLKRYISTHVSTEEILGDFSWRTLLDYQILKLYMKPSIMFMHYIIKRIFMQFNARESFLVTRTEQSCKEQDVSNGE